jgi:hypothetical protein
MNRRVKPGGDEAFAALVETKTTIPRACRPTLRQWLLQSGRPCEQSHFPPARQHWNMAPGSFPHAQVFVPFVQR